MTPSNLAPRFSERFPEFTRIGDLWAEGRLDESAAVLDAIPTSPELLLARTQQEVLEAYVAGEAPDRNQIRVLVAEALESAPDRPDLLVVAALVAFDAEDYQAVQDRLRELHAMNPTLALHEDAAAAFLVGMQAWWLGRTGKVEEPLRLAVRLDPEEPRYQRALDRFVTGHEFPGPQV